MALRNPDSTVRERELERTGKRLGHSAPWFLILGVVLAVPGVVLILVDTTWSLAFGAVLVLFGSIPGIVGIGLLVSALVARWSARHKSFA